MELLPIFLDMIITFLVVYKNKHLFLNYDRVGHLCGVGNGNRLQCSCLGNPRDRGAWWALVCGVAQSQTRLKRLSSSSSRVTLGSGRRMWLACWNNFEAGTEAKPVRLRTRWATSDHLMG